MGNSFFESCATLAPLYSQLIKENKRVFPSIENDIWDSVGFFLRGYAFERQGRAPDYHFAAAAAICKQTGASMDEKSAREVWDAFKKEIGHERKKLRLNCKNNPLCPKGTVYGYKKKKRRLEAAVRKMSIIEVVFRDLNGAPLVSWARERLQSGEIKFAHVTVKKVNGIGNKIASFFLRDITTMYGVKVDGDHKKLLQPIDTWVRFVSQACWPSKRVATDQQCAELIVQNSAVPEITNQGIWYFCTQAAQSSQYLVRRAINDESYFWELMALHSDKLRQLATASVLLKA